MAPTIPIGFFQVSSPPLNPPFNSGTGFNGALYSIAVQSDGNYIVGGSFVTYKSSARTRIARLFPNGNVDTSLVTGTGFDSIVYAIGIQSTGKIIAGGSFVSYNGVTVNRICRLNTDGSLDLTFNTGTAIPGGLVEELKVLGDDTIVCTGSFTSFNGTTCAHIIKLNADGTLNSTFGTGLSSNASSLAIQSDGKIVVGGIFGAANSVNRGKLARFLSDAVTVDTGFDTSVGSGGGFNVGLQVPQTLIQHPNGKILSFGDFNTYKGTSRYGGVLIGTSALNDGSFSMGTGFNNGVGLNSSTCPLCVGILSDGSIIVGGAFTAYNGTSVGGIMKIGVNGVIDPTFNPGGAGFLLNPSPGSVRAIQILPDDKILVGGTFDRYNGAVRRNFIRLFPDGSSDTI